MCGICFGKLWQRNKLVVTDFVLQRIWNNFNPPPKDEGILVTEAQLNNNINVILSLTKRVGTRFIPSSYSTCVTTTLGVLHLSKTKR